MNLYITNDAVDSMTGVAIAPELVNNMGTHLVMASRKWDEAYVDCGDEIQEGWLRLLHTQCSKIFPRVPEHPTRHQMILLTELFPELAGTIRLAFMKGESMYGVLPQVWEQGSAPGRDAMQLPTA